MTEYFLHASDAVHANGNIETNVTGEGIFTAKIADARWGMNE
jgi:hypothetical protein